MTSDGEAIAGTPSPTGDPHARLVDPLHWAQVFPSSSSVKVPAGTTLAEEGEPTSAVVMLLDGLVHLVRRTRGGQDRVVGWRQPGAIIGSAAAVSGRLYAVTAVTLIESRVATVSTRLFLDALDRDAAFNRLVHAAHGAEVWDQIDRDSDLACLHPPARLAKFLLRFVAPAERVGPTRSVTVRTPVGLVVVAAEIGVDPKTLSRTIAGLVRRGALTRGHNERTFTFVPALLLRAVGLDEEEVI